MKYRVELMAGLCVSILLYHQNAKDLDSIKMSDMILRGNTSVSSSGIVVGIRSQWESSQRHAEPIRN